MDISETVLELFDMRMIRPTIRQLLDFDINSLQSGDDATGL